MRRVFSVLLVLVLAACSSTDDDKTSNDGRGGGGDGGGGSDVGGSTTCADPDKLVTLADDLLIRDLTLDGSALYLVATKGSAGSVQKVALTGGAPVELAAQGGYSIVVNDTHVFWVDATTVWRVAKAGGQPEKVAVNALGKPEGRALAVDDGYVYFNHGNYLARVAKTASNTASYQTVDKVAVNSMVLVGDTIYYVTDHTIGKVAKAGGDPTVLADGLDALNDLAVCGNTVYVVDYGEDVASGARLLKVPTSGGTPEQIGASFTGLRSGALGCDGTHVYFSGKLGMELDRVPVAGGAVQKLVCPGGYHLALNDQTIYWIDYNTNIVDKLAK